MDAYNFRVMIRCHKCGEVCEKWEGDELPGEDDALAPVCPDCFKAGSTVEWWQMVEHWDKTGGWES